METKDSDKLNLEFEKFKKELEKDIKFRKCSERFDFNFAHILIWSSVIASFSASIFISYQDHEYLTKLQLAFLAGIPGLIVIIEKTFDFTQRAVWDTMYKIEMESLRDEINFTEIKPEIAAKKFREIKLKYESSYLKIGFFSQKKSDLSAKE